MTDQEINIKVAELDGWKNFYIPTSAEELVHPESKPYGTKPPTHRGYHDIIEYTSSIDAIREVILKMSEDEQNKFENELAELIYKNGMCCCHQLTARDWCIAFLKVKGVEV